MAREVRGGGVGDGRPTNLPKVSKVELTAKNVKLRIAAVCILVVVAVVAFGYAVGGLLKFDVGEKVIEYSGLNDETVADELTFRYYCDSKSIFNSLTKEYSALTEYSYRVFAAVGSFDGVSGLAALNSRPNEAVAVEPLLYSALEKLVDAGNRSIFAAPVYTVYQNIFSCTDDAVARENDPEFSEEVRDELERTVAFTSSEQHIKIELLGGDNVRLCVSDEYLAYAAESGIDAFVDLYQLRGAFVVDYIADSLIEKGYSGGMISSQDGYCRTFDDEGKYSARLFNLASPLKVYEAARLDYTGSVASVMFYSYPLGGEYDEFSYYCYADGTLRHNFIDPETGLCSAKYSEVVFASREDSCADVALAAYDAIVGLRGEQNAVRIAIEEKYSCVFLEQNIIYKVGEIFNVSEIYSDQNIKYTTENLG